MFFCLLGVIGVRARLTRQNEFYGDGNVYLFPTDLGGKVATLFIGTWSKVGESLASVSSKRS